MLTYREEGQRLYICGDTYPHRGVLSEFCTFERDRGWWCGKKLRKRLEEALAKINAPPVEVDTDEQREADRQALLGRGLFNGEVHYIATDIGRGRVRLLTADGKRTVWADAQAVTVQRVYSKPMSLAKLQAYKRDMQAADSYARRTLAAGERELTRPAQGRADRFVVGEVLHAPRVEGGGGPDGHYFVVVAEGKWKDDDDDEWYCGAHVRAATAEEAAPKVREVAASERHRAEAAAREVARRAVVDFVKGGTTAHKRALASRLLSDPSSSVLYAREPYPTGLSTREAMAAVEAHWERLQSFGCSPEALANLGFENLNGRDVGVVHVAVVGDDLRIYLDRCYQDGAAPGPELRTLALTPELRAAVDGLLPKKAAGPGVTSIVLGRREAGSETLYIGPESVTYVESSVDDMREWTAPLTDALRAGLAQLKAYYPVT